MVHPDHLLDALTPAQFEEWCEHFRAEPFGLEDLQHARLMSLVASVAGGKIDNRDPSHHDFLLGAGEEQVAREMTTAETVAALTELWSGGAALPQEVSGG